MAPLPALTPPPHSTLHTPHSTPHTPHATRHTPHATRHTPLATLYPPATPPRLASPRLAPLQGYLVRYEDDDEEHLAFETLAQAPPPPTP